MGRLSGIMVTSACRCRSEAGMFRIGETHISRKCVSSYWKSMLLFLHLARALAAVVATTTRECARGCLACGYDLRATRPLPGVRTQNPS